MIINEKQIVEASELMIQDYQIENGYYLESITTLDNMAIKLKEMGITNRDNPFSLNIETYVFAIGSYFGETIRKNFPHTDWSIENEEQHILDISLVINKSMKIWPFRRVLKAMKNQDDSLVSFITYLQNKHRQ